MAKTGEGRNDWSFLPPAEEQSNVGASELINSANAGVLIVRRGQVRNSYRHDARVFARDVSAYINSAQKGVCTVFNYEETFGLQDRIYWLIHMNTLDDYVKLLEMGKNDNEFQEIFRRQRTTASENGSGAWDEMFTDASFEETVLTPHHWQSHGTVVSDEKKAAAAKKGGRKAQDQTSVSSGQLYHSGNARMLLLRSGQLRSEARSAGREFARDVAEYINQRQAGLASTFLYEEHFGVQDRIWWITHFRTPGDYEVVSEMGTSDEGFRGIFHKTRANWDKMFIEGSITERVIMPQHPLIGQ